MINASKPLVLAVARWPVGGIRTYLRDLFAAPALQGYEFILLAPDEDALSDYLAKETLRCKEWIETDASPQRFVGSVIKATRALRPALVHSHGFLSGMFAGLACELTRYRHLLTVHDVLLDKQFAGAAGRVREFGLGISLAFPDRIHCVTNDSLDNLSSRYPWLWGLKRKSEVITHGVDVARIARAPRRDIAAELGCDSKTKVLGFLGRFMAQKGFRVLTDAMALLKDQGVSPQQVKILAVGSGSFLRQDQARIASMGLQDFFTFWPYQPDVSSILKGIDALVMPSLWEASGLLAMEAMVAGTPVIGTSCVGLRETLGGTPAVQVAPGNASELSAAIQNFLKFDSADAAMQFAPQAARRFDSNAAFAGLSQLYGRVTNSP